MRTWLLLALLCAAASVSPSGGAPPEANTAASGIRMPRRIFTPEMLALHKKGKPYSDLFRLSRGWAQGARRYEKIPASRWKEIIPPYSPVSIAGSARRRPGKCPFCGKPFRGCAMDDEAFLATPFQAKTRCCGRVVYEREADMPAGYPARPNHTEPIPHLDGTTCNYRFYVPPGFEKDRHNWFSSAGEVWRARQDRILFAVFRCGSGAHYGDSKAALTLAAIFDRLADVVPGYPLYDSHEPHGFARGRDGKRYLTRKEYLSVPRPQRFEKPFWYFSGFRAWHFDKMPASSRFGGWHDGVMYWAGALAAAFEHIRDRPEVKAWSRARYGDPDAFGRRVMERVFKEYALLCKSVPPTRHNTNWTWVRGAFKFGVLTQDPYFLEELCRLLESNVVNNYFSDGLSSEGSFNYAGLPRNLIVNLWIVEYLKGVDLGERYPILKQIRALGDYPIVTLYNVESMHGDECARFFASQRRRARVQPPAPKKVDYAGHERSLCFPETGLACLRAGAPGSRLETVMDFQVASTSHTHSGRLNMQLFYEGINILPDFGYASYQAYTFSAGWKNHKYNFEKLPLRPPSLRFREAYVKQPRSHCTGLMDGLNHKRGPATFHRFLGGQALSDPAYAVQFAEADARATLTTDITTAGGVMSFAHPKGKVDRFHRQLATLTLPNGRSVAVDVFRMKGGRLHEMYWHVPAEDATTSLGEPERLPHRTLQDYMRSDFGAKPSNFRGVPTDTSLEFLNKPRRWKAPEGVWRAEWRIRPSKFEPVTKKGRKRYAKWKRILHDADLRMWGFVDGDRAERDEILAARGPWPSAMVEKGRRGEVYAFVDALQFLAVARRARKAPLTTTFVHVLEPRNPDQPPTLDAVEPLRAAARDEAAGVGVRLRTRKGSGPALDVLFATTANGGDFRSGDFALKGRLGMACPEALSLLLYDGTGLRVGGLGVSLDPSWRLKLVEVGGDLTGRPKESALIVQSDRPLPTDATLAGQMLTVEHRVSDIHTSGYTIARVRGLGAGRYRIDLRGTPPFIQFRTRVRKIHGRNPRMVFGSTHNTKGACCGIFAGRRIRFPRTGFTSAIKAIRAARESGTDLIEMATTPRKGDIAVGDPFIVYTIQPRDEVVIPTLFAARASKVEGASLKLRVFTTGTATLRLPGRYRPVSLTSGGRPVPLALRRGDGQVVVTIGRGALRDGRAELNLKRVEPKGR